MENNNQELIEKLEGEIRAYKNLLDQGDYKARKLLFEACSILFTQVTNDMPVFEYYRAAEEQAQTYRDEINRLEKEIEELSK